METYIGKEKQAHQAKGKIEVFVRIWTVDVGFIRIEN